MVAPVNLTPDAGTDFRPHGISLFVGPDGRATLFVVNHPGESLFGAQHGTSPRVRRIASKCSIWTG